ncbi:thiamine pyrophosphate-dependent enzyme [Pelosinus sp. sgz500959]|uniref:thiamine pyrophosphate-dependent enzyme n=1 Tax=Pelosinus sp. sgz500959 TaxID=3242472 RepID=UPI00366C5ABA
MSEKIFSRPQSLTDIQTHYCPGCHHGIIHRLVAEVIDELGLQEKTIAVVPVGCSAMADEYFNMDSQQAAHGRAPAVATGIKRVHPDRVVFTYQGDGDIAAIGCAEIVHAALRGEKITTIFVNNAIYGMTGGQMAPTTLAGQKTATSPDGRQSSSVGMPMGLSEMLATLDGAKYIARVAVDSPKNMATAKNSIKEAFQVQLRQEGFAMVEVLSTCPTNWGKTPIEAVQWLRDNMMPQFPLGIYKNAGGEKQ